MSRVDYTDSPICPKCGAKEFWTALHGKQGKQSKYKNTYWLFQCIQCKCRWTMRGSKVKRMRTATGFIEVQEER